MYGTAVLAYVIVVLLDGVRFIVVVMEIAVQMVQLTHVILVVEAVVVIRIVIHVLVVHMLQVQVVVMALLEQYLKHVTVVQHPELVIHVKQSQTIRIAIVVRMGIVHLVAE